MSTTLPRAALGATLLPAILTLAAAAGCGDVYDPPPELESASLSKGVYFPDRGPLTVALSETVDEATLRVRLLRARHNTEQDLCFDRGQGLPDGCHGAAEEIVGPGSDAIRVEGRRRVLLDVGELVEPYTTYVVHVAAGLADDAGRATAVPIEVPFIVAGDLEPGEVDFESGMFLALLEVVEPIPTRVTMFLWLDVDPATGALCMFGADGDPKDASVVERTTTNRNAEIWQVDAEPPGGFTVRARGLIGETGGELVVTLLPFDLETFTPPATVEGAEYQGRVSVGEVEGGPPGERQQIAGQLAAERVVVGLGGTTIDVAGGSGPLSMYRLKPEEQPAIEGLVRSGEPTVCSELGGFRDE